MGCLAGRTLYHSASAVDDAAVHDQDPWTCEGWPDMTRVGRTPYLALGPACFATGPAEHESRVHEGKGELPAAPWRASTHLTSSGDYRSYYRPHANGPRRSWPRASRSADES